MNERSYSPTSIDKKCIANLKAIDKLLKHYLHHTARVLGFPRNLDEIHSLSDDRSLFVCLGDKNINLAVKTSAFRTSYEVVNDPLNPNPSVHYKGRLC